MNRKEKLNCRERIVALVQKYGVAQGEPKEIVFQDFLKELDALLGVPAAKKRPPGFATAPKAVQEWATKVMVATDSAIKEFGRYTFGDKGPNEVMDLDPFIRELKAMDPAEAGIRLEALAVCGRDYNTAAASILSGLDDQEEKWWTICYEACSTVDY